MFPDYDELGCFIFSHRPAAVNTNTIQIECKVNYNKMGGAKTKNYSGQYSSI